MTAEPRKPRIKMQKKGLVFGRHKWHHWEVASQWQQDTWLLQHVFQNKHKGIFVEAGANDGVSQSNTLRMSRRGWHGILVEPSEAFQLLRKVRDESLCLPFCLAQHDNEYVQFNECVKDTLYSGRVDFIPDKLKEVHNNHRRIVTRRTIALGTLLDLVAAPRHIDYLSLDTEGSEVEILKGITFERYTFGALSVELNGHKTEIDELLAKHGYDFVTQLGGDGMYLPEGTYDAAIATQGTRPA